MMDFHSHLVHKMGSRYESKQQMRIYDQRKQLQFALTALISEWPKMSFYEYYLGLGHNSLAQTLFRCKNHKCFCHQGFCEILSQITHYCNPWQHTWDTFCAKVSYQQQILVRLDKHFLNKQDMGWRHPISFLHFQPSKSKLSEVYCFKEIHSYKEYKVSKTLHK